MGDKINIQTSYVPTAEISCQMLSTSNALNGVYFDYDLMLELQYYYYAMADKAFGKIARYLGILQSNLKDDTIKSLIQRQGYAAYFPKTPRGDISLNAKELEIVFNRGIIDKELATIVKMYSRAKSSIAVVNQFDKMMDLGHIDDRLSYNHHRMLRLEPLWVPQNTGRFAMQRPAIQNINRLAKGITTAPEGYVLVHCDSGQIDPRITFSYKMPIPQMKYLIELYDDAYFGIVHYIELTDSELATGKCDFGKMEITDELKAKRSALKRHINAVIYDSQDDEGDPVKRKLIQRIGNHPLHRKWVDETREQLMNGDFVFKTAFGTGVDVQGGTNNEGKYADASENAKFNHYARSAINAPIQGTAADLHRMALEKENRYLLERGSKSFIMLSEHDAISTCIHEDAYDDEIEFIKSCPRYEVEGWIPINASCEIGQDSTNELFTHNRY